MANSASTESTNPIRFPAWESLTAVRTAAGLNVTDLGRAARMNVSHVHDLEKGRNRPRPATVKKLADALGVSVAAIPVPPLGRAQPAVSPPDDLADLIAAAVAIELDRRGYPARSW